MAPTREDLAGLPELVAVADQGSFTAAAATLGVTPSAISQSLAALERRLGVRLLQRTTRNVGLTEAGARFLAHVRPALTGVEAAVAALDELRTRPAGTLRLSVPRLASALVMASLLEPFLTTYPEVRLDLVIDDAFVDLTAGEFDAGIRLGEALDKDVVAVRLTGEMRSAIVASPAYLARRGRPRHPRDLVDHDCINYRQSSRRTLYRWELVIDGKDVTIPVTGRVITNDGDVMLRAAADGLGLAYVVEELAQPLLAAGRLVRVLTRYCPTFPGLHLYYPSRRQAPAKLRALLDFLQAQRRT